MRTKESVCFISIGISDSILPSVLPLTFVIFFSKLRTCYVPDPSEGNFDKSPGRMGSSKKATKL